MPIYNTIKINFDGQKVIQGPVLTTGDADAYGLILEFYKNGKFYDITGCNIAVYAKFAGLPAPIPDIGTVVNGKGYYIIKPSMYVYAGEMQLEIALSDNTGMHMVTKVLHCPVRSGFAAGQLIAAADYSVLATLIGQAQAAVANANNAAGYANDKGDKIEVLVNGDNIAIGIGAEGSDGGVAIGKDTYSENGGVAIGSLTSADGGIAMGHNVDSDWISVAIGNDSYAESGGVALGKSAYGGNDGIAIGNNAEGTDAGVAIGDGTTAEGDDVAIGRYAYSNNVSVAVGADSYSRNRSVAIGAGASSDYNSVAIGDNAQNYGLGRSFAKGADTEISRYGEEKKSADYYNKNSYSFVNWNGKLTTTSSTEIFLNGVTGQRFILEDNSVLLLKLMITMAERYNVLKCIEADVVVSVLDGETNILKQTQNVITGSTGYDILFTTVDYESLTIKATSKYGSSGNPTFVNVTGIVSEMRF